VAWLGGLALALTLGVLGGQSAQAALVECNFTMQFIGVTPFGDTTDTPNPFTGLNGTDVYSGSFSYDSSAAPASTQGPNPGGFQ
jgi:hypothetical protein